MCCGHRLCAGSAPAARPRPIPGSRARHSRKRRRKCSGATAGGKLYVFAGLAPGWKPKAHGLRIRSRIQSMGEEDAPMRLASHHVAFATLNNKIYAFGGFTLPEPVRRPGTRSNNAWEYDPATDEWKELAPHADQARRRGGRCRQRQDLRHRRRQLAARRHRKRHPSRAPHNVMADGRGIRPRDQHLEDACAAAARARNHHVARRRRRQGSMSSAAASARPSSPAPATTSTSSRCTIRRPISGPPRARMPTARSAIGAGVYNNHILVAGGEGQDQRFLAAFKAVEASRSPRSTAGRSLPSMPRPRARARGRRHRQSPLYRERRRPIGRQRHRALGRALQRDPAGRSGVEVAAGRGSSLSPREAGHSGARRSRVPAKRAPKLAPRCCRWHCASAGRDPESRARIFRARSFWNSCPVGVDGPRRHRCARMRSLQISNRGAVRGEAYPHWYGHVQECFRAAWRGCGRSSRCCARSCVGSKCMSSLRKLAPTRIGHRRPAEQRIIGRASSKRLGTRGGSAAAAICEALRQARQERCRRCRRRSARR